MYRSEAINLISSRLGQRSGLDNQIKTEMLLAQTELERSPWLPWFLLAEDTNLTTVAEQRTVDVPSDFLMEYEDIPIYLTDTDGEEYQLTKDDYDALASDTYIEDSGRPTHYDLVGAKWYFFPEPDAAYSLRVFYYAAAQTLDQEEDLENAWLAYAPDLLIAKTGLAMARFLRDNAAIQLFAADLQKAEQRILQLDTARKEAARAVFMGG